MLWKNNLGPVQFITVSTTTLSPMAITKGLGTGRLRIRDHSRTEHLKTHVDRWSQTRSWTLLSGKVTRIEVVIWLRISILGMPQETNLTQRASQQRTARLESLNHL
jgi:hypothetical protein